MLEKLVERTGSAIDFSGFFSKPFIDKLSRDLEQAGLFSNPREYVSFAVTSSIFATAVTAVILALLDFPLESLASLPLVFAVTFTLLCNYPHSRKRRKALMIERELPMALRTIAVEVSIGLPFERALKTISKSRRGELSSEFKRTLADVEKGGSSVSEALKSLAQRVDSILVKRTAMQLAFTYEQGLGGEGLRKLAEELSATQKASVKEYSAKMTFFGLLFVAASCITPALFAAYVIVGSSFLETVFTPFHVATAYLAVFPAIDFAILYYLKKKTPVVLGL